MTRPLLRLAALLSVAALVAACGDDGDVERSDTSSTTSTSATQRSVPDLRDETLELTTVVDELNQPTAIAFIDEGMLVTEKASGRVKLVRDGQVVADVLDLAVNYFDERGLLGIAVHPDFTDAPFVYLHWTWRGAGDGAERLYGDDSEDETEVPALGNRIDRFAWDGEQLDFDRNLVQFPSHTLEEDTSGRVRGNHDAGPLTFGPDGKLYTMMGDQNLRGHLQNVLDGPPPDDEHLAGVVLRLNDDGTTPSDNPFYDAGAAVGGQVGSNIQRIYAYGIRNSFGLAFEPLSGALWQTENGDDSFDEINVLTPGANSGWLQIQGPPERFDTYRQIEQNSEDGIDTPGFTPDRFASDAAAAEAAMYQLVGSQFTGPVLSYVHPPALTAIGFVPDDRLGATSTRSTWVGTVLTDSLLRYPLAADGRDLALESGLADRVDDNTEKGDLGESEPFVVGTGFGVVTDIELAPDGLYVVSHDTGTITRITAAAP